MRADGFTIMEAAVSMAVVAILSAAALPLLPAGHGDASRARGLEALLSKARASAVAAGRPVAVCFGETATEARWGACSGAPVRSVSGAPLSADAADAPLPAPALFGADGSASARFSLQAGSASVEVERDSGVAKRRGK